MKSSLMKRPVLPWRPKKCDGSCLITKAAFGTLLPAVTVPYLRHITYTAFGAVVQPSLPAGDLPRFLYTGPGVRRRDRIVFLQRSLLRPCVRGDSSARTRWGTKVATETTSTDTSGNNVTNLTDPTGRIFESLW